jgi:DNA-binding MarR family transcriptional regulator
MVVNRTRTPGEDLFLQLGLAYLSQFLAQRVNELVLAGGKRQGFREMRISHGYLIQHLVESDCPVSRTGTELARRLGVSQQAASKSVGELARLGVVEIRRLADRRAKEVCLSKRGWEMVLQARKSRAGIEAKLIRQVGSRRYRDAQRTLSDCLELLGGVDRIRSRRVREPE